MKPQKEQFADLLAFLWEGLSAICITMVGSPYNFAAVIADQLFLFQENVKDSLSDAASSSSLPLCQQDGLKRGIVTGNDIRLYLKIASTPILSWICRISPFLRERVMGNPRFLLILAIEEIIGVSAKTAAEVQGRGDEFWNVRPTHDFLHSVIYSCSQASCGIMFTTFAAKQAPVMGTPSQQQTWLDKTTTDAADYFIECVNTASMAS